MFTNAPRFFYRGALLALVCACFPRQDAKPTLEPDAGPGEAVQGGARSPEPGYLHVVLNLTGNSAFGELEIENFTGSKLVFRTGVQILDGVGADVVPVILGPDMTVEGKSKGATWSAALPPLPDGYFEVAFRAFIELPTHTLGSSIGRSRYIHVKGGVVSEIDYFVFSEHAIRPTLHLEAEPGRAARAHVRDGSDLRREGECTLPRTKEEISVPVAGRFVRGDGEWLGMLPESDDIWPCMPDGSCAKARACVGGQCLPCLADSECRCSELCVLGHCLLDDLVECSTRLDCQLPGAQCVLTGYTSLDPRGNRDMRAYCLGPSGKVVGAEEAAALALKLQNASIVPMSEATPSPEARMRAALEAARRREPSGSPP